MVLLRLMKMKGYLQKVINIILLIQEVHKKSGRKDEGTIDKCMSTK
jgi:hypothetical protein